MSFMFLISFWLIVSVVEWIKQSTNNTEVMSLISREHTDFLNVMN